MAFIACIRDSQNCVIRINRLIIIRLVAGEAFPAGTAGGSLVTVGTLPPGMAS